MSDNVHPEFNKWPSIQRLSSETCYITEKIDGTNGVIHVSEDGLVLAGSRERWLSLPDGKPPLKKDDNFGFASWVHERAEALKRLGPGYHYGEFHGGSIQRKYGLPTRRWASFEFWRNGEQIHEDVGFVPLLYEGELVDGLIDNIVAKLNINGSVMYPGFIKPEGVVITFKNMKHAKFKRLCENDRLHKSQQVRS